MTGVATSAEKPPLDLFQEAQLQEMVHTTTMSSGRSNKWTMTMIGGLLSVGKMNSRLWRGVLLVRVIHPSTTSATLLLLMSTMIGVALTEQKPPSCL